MEEHAGEKYVATAEEDSRIHVSFWELYCVPHWTFPQMSYAGHTWLPSTWHLW